MSDLVTLIDETVDEVIDHVRKETTNFDNVWLPSEEFPLDNKSNFIKYLGYNTVLVQDIKGNVFYLR